ncbi:hypothetical protein GALMADRAFT_1132928 [Galerina marginata CBS 339.88]|uniref:Uncharacterized protein n=1 Tax=Galerina marginata (strain CBS 339.88) TaxID=685588 RepID=A0A067S884_GALM3|nr:hypothetical protein GALMADRAFT_1132928 [Galerina marginata CBS 339.88]
MRHTSFFVVVSHCSLKCSPIPTFAFSSMVIPISRHPDAPPRNHPQFILRSHHSRFTLPSVLNYFSVLTSSSFRIFTSYFHMIYSESIVLPVYHLKSRLVRRRLDLELPLSPSSSFTPSLLDYDFRPRPSHFLSIFVGPYESRNAAQSRSLRLLICCVSSGALQVHQCVETVIDRKEHMHYHPPSGRGSDKVQ